MIFAIFLILLALSVVLYSLNKKYYSFIIYSFFITNGFQLLSNQLINDAPISKIPDYGNFFIIFIVIIEALKSKNFFTIKNDFLAKILVVLLLYIILELFITVLFTDESFSYALKVFRQFTFLTLYFIIRKLNVKDLQNALKFISILTLITSLVYLTQIVFKTQILQGQIDGIEGNNVDSGTRYRNIPIFIDFFLIISILTKKQNFTSLFKLGIFLVVLVASLNRGPIIALGIVVFAYFLYEKKHIQFVKYSIISALVLLISWPIISDRFEGGNSKSDIEGALSIRNFEDYEVGSTEGTFTFRMALLLERIKYFEENPQKLLLGVGLLHEDSPNTESNFHFVIGADKFDVKGGRLKQQLDTTDLVWATMLLRLGLVGVVIFIILFIHLFIYFKQNRKLLLGASGFLLIAMYLINSFATDILIRPSSFLIYYLVYAIIKNFKLFKENEISIYSKKNNFVDN